MKNKFLIILLSALVFLINNSTNAQCYNGDLEANDFTNWTAWTGTNVNGVVNWNQMTLGVSAPSHTIVTTGNDPVIGAALPMVVEGNYSIRLGDANSMTGSSARIVAYTFTVNSSNANFSFKYAMVLEDPRGNNVTAHTNIQKPFFSYVISKGAPVLGMPSKAKRIKAASFTADATDPFFTIDPTPLSLAVYKQWQTECVDLHDYIGQTLTVYFTTADCSLNGHFGYAYIDALCLTNNPVPDFTYPTFICVNDGLAVDPTSSTNVTDYYWKIEKLSSNNINNVIPNSGITVYRYNQPPVPVADLFNFSNFRFMNVTNGYYKITLGVKNCFSNWVEKSVVVDVRFPQINVPNEYIYRCCGDPTLPVLAASIEVPTGIVFGNFNWFDATGAALGTGAITTEDISGATIYTTTFTPVSGDNGKYRVQYIDQLGCKNEKWVYVLNKTDFTPVITTDFCTAICNSAVSELSVNLSYDQNSYCGPNFDTELFKLIRAASNHTFLWSTGETTQTINVHSGVTNYSVTVSNGCYTRTTSFDISTLQHIEGSIEKGDCISGNNGEICIPDLAAPSLGIKVRVAELGLAIGAFPAYNATYYDFKVYNRFGEKIHHQWKNAPCDGFINGEIEWDGVSRKYNWNGNTLKQLKSEIGTYYYQLIFNNCDLDPNSEMPIKGDITVAH